jgi:hypothetical protein
MNNSPKLRPASNGSRLRVFGSAALFLVLSGCIQAKLKRLEIRQLETELAQIEQTAIVLRPQPQLGQQYGARLYIRGDLFNRFLDGLRDYDIPLASPKGAVIKLDGAQIAFQEGSTQAIVNARAVNRKGNIEVKVRMRADLLMSANPDEGKVSVRFALREIVPDVRISIFRLGELWFVGQLLRLEAQKYVDALPATELPLSGNLPIVMDPPTRTRIEIGDGWMDVDQKLPRFELDYRYRVQSILPLSDGLHFLFALERVK